MRPHNTEAICSGLTAPHGDTARRAGGIAGLRGNSLGISPMLIAEYGLGIGVSLYVHTPAADRGNGIASALGRALTSQPVVLAVHAGLGLLLLVAAVNVLTRAIRPRHRFPIPPPVPALLPLPPPTSPERRNGAAAGRGAGGGPQGNGPARGGSPPGCPAPAGQAR